MKHIFRRAALSFAVILTVFMSGCSFSKQPSSAIWDYDYSKMNFVQLDEPEQGRQMCVIETTLGTIKAVLYPEMAPNTVDNFIKRAENGYYDNKLIYSVVDKACFQTGALDETFNSGVTNDGNPIPNEYSVDLWPFKGALCGFYNEFGYSDSRFFVVNEFEVKDEDIDILREQKTNSGEEIPEDLLNTMKNEAGFWQISGYYTVFGQTIEGLDIIEKISQTEVDENSKPLEDVYINSITITTYDKG